MEREKTFSYLLNVEAKKKNKNWIFYDTISKEKSIVLAISLVLLFYLFINPNILLLLSQQMAFSVF